MEYEDFLKKDEQQAVICMACMSPNNESDDVCQNCGARLSGPSGLDPIQTIRDEGTLLRKAVSARPKFIVLFGAWLISTAWIITVIALEIGVISNWNGLFSLVFFWFGVALFFLPVYVLFKVTKNYLNAREAYQAKAGKEQLKEENRQRAKARRRARMKSESGW
jgi:hypothetical protein